MMTTATTTTASTTAMGSSRPPNAQICWAHGFCFNFYFVLSLPRIWCEKKKEFRIDLAWLGKIVCMTYFFNQFHTKFPYPKSKTRKTGTSRWIQNLIHAANYKGKKHIMHIITWLLAYIDLVDEMGIQSWANIKHLLLLTTVLISNHKINEK